MAIFSSQNTTLQQQEKVFDLFIIFTYVFYASAIIGVTFIKPSWFLTVDFIAKIYVAVFLVYRYNPFLQKPKYTRLDRKVSFHAGVFILVTVITRTMLANYAGKHSKWFKNTGICSTGAKEDNTETDIKAASS